MNGHHLCKHPAPRGESIPPRWTRGNKDMVGTAYSTSSQVWYTVSHGLLNEVYYPTLDRPQLRDLQFLVTDGETFFHDERRHLTPTMEPLSPHCLGLRVTSEAPDGLYRIVKEILSDPHEATVLIRTRLEAEPDVLSKLKLFVLCAPHLGGGGAHNNGEVTDCADQPVLIAHRGDDWLALGASIGFARCSVGYIGVNDGWQDLNDNFKMDWEYDCALDGNIALMAELDLSQGTEFTLGLAFGLNRHHVITTLFQSLGIPFKAHQRRFTAQWQRACAEMADLTQSSGDEGKLYRRSQSLLLAHEDKGYPGAMIASLSIPWGEVKDDEAGVGGYHLVWTRDAVHSVMGLLATNNTQTPLRTLIYLAVAQLPDGSFYQNFWVNGDPFWKGVQLDEVAFPILLARRLHTMDALQNFDLYPMVRKAAGYLIRTGPVTPQERWEEASGYSPSTLAVNIAALTCAAAFARERGDETTANFIQEHADFLECHIETWTVTTEGTLLADVPRHFIRIHPVEKGDAEPNENPNEGTLQIANRPPDARGRFPAKDVVDAGFLELVRYGIRAAGDPLIEDSLKVVDALLKVETSHGPAWRRYNHDGYGQRDDGSAYDGWGVGRAWPLLAGERGHYELAAGRPVEPYLHTLEAFATGTGLLAEQVWDQEDVPDKHLFCGEPTGSATPLMWAHSEYIRLLRSAADGAVFDLIPEVVERYQNGKGERKLLEIWKPNRHARSVRAGWTLRVQAPAAFCLHWSDDGWQERRETVSTPTALGIEYVDFPIGEEQQGSIQFTFHWTESERWEERDYEVRILAE